MSVPAAVSFRFCPACAAAVAPSETTRFYRCAACDYTLYFNAGCSVSAIVQDRAGRVALLRRAREPRRGMLALPGGFAEPGESADESLRREVREEIGLELDKIAFLTALPNSYPYRGVLYPTLDLVYTARAAGGVEAAQADEVSAIVWVAPEAIPLDEIAFPSLREALRQYQAGFRDE